MGRQFSRRFLFIISTATLLIFFQNFSYEEHKNEFKEVDSQLLNPDIKTKSDLAIPQGGSDLESVFADWSSRQKDILLQGRDKALLDQWNQKIQDYFSSDDPKEKEPSRQPASEESGNRKRQPASVRITRVNEVEYRMSPSTSAVCTYDGHTAEFLLSKNLGASKIVFRHLPTQGSTSLSFNLNF